MSRTSQTMSGQSYRAPRRIKKVVATTASTPEKGKEPQGPQLSHADLMAEARKIGLSSIATTNLIDTLLSCQIQASKGKGQTVQSLRDNFRSGGQHVSLAAVAAYGEDSTLTLSGANGLRRILQNLRLPPPAWLERKIQRLSDSR